MKIIKMDNMYTVFSGDSVEIYDFLPVGTYLVQFKAFQGFYLEKVTDLHPNEEKIYGNSLKKVDTVFSALNDMKRSLGVLLSGGKGHGKTLLLRSLAERAQASKYPVILVSIAYDGIAEFLNSIHQEVMVAFDEFEKIFTREEDDEDGLGSTQNALLSLFDGISSSKKLLVATVNDMFKLSSFFLNRPGRFHYHFRFGSPSAEETQEYLTDKLTQRKEEIPAMVDFLNSITSSYDILRALVFELNRREDSLPLILDDLNIMATDTPSFKITCYFRDTKKKIAFTREVKYSLSLWKEKQIQMNFDFRNLDYAEDWIHLTLDLSKRTKNTDGTFEIPGSAIQIMETTANLSVERMFFRKHEESWSYFPTDAM